MDSIKTILPHILKDIKRKQGYSKEEIESLWVHSVKKNMALHSQANFLKNGKLYVSVENPAWLYELRINKKQILEKLNKKSENKIKDVSLRVGDIHGSRE